MLDNGATIPKLQLEGYSNIATRYTNFEMVKFLDGNGVEGSEVGSCLGSCGA
jgi:hypothetical protein